MSAKNIKIKFGLLRDDKWLLSRLDYLWSNYFTDVKQTDPVFIKFGRHSRLRLGSIRLDKIKRSTYITITGMFKDERVPQEVVDQTIAHELAHYTHGFSSFRSRMHKYPHGGGVVDWELKKRGLGHLVIAYKEWIKEYRKKF